MERMIRIMNIFSMEYLSILLHLVAAMVLGGLVGLERAGKSHDAGLRTHILVCIGSAAVMVLSECLVRQYNINAEIMRMGAQVISGIGFLSRHDYCQRRQGKGAYDGGGALDYRLCRTGGRRGVLCDCHNCGRPDAFCNAVPASFDALYLQAFEHDNNRPGGYRGLFNA